MSRYIVLSTYSKHHGEDEGAMGLALVKFNDGWPAIIAAAQQALDAVAGYLPYEPGKPYPQLRELTLTVERNMGAWVLINDGVAGAYWEPHEYATNQAILSALSSWTGVMEYMAAGRVDIDDQHPLSAVTLDECTMELTLRDFVRHDRREQYAFLSDDDWATRTFSPDALASILSDPNSPHGNELSPLEGGE